MGLKSTYHFMQRYAPDLKGASYTEARMAAAAAATTKDDAPAKQGERTDLADSTKLSQGTRASKRGVSRDTQKQLAAVVQEAKELGEISNPKGGAPKGNENARKGNNRNQITVDSVKRGTGATYLARRLLRDAPDVFKRLEAGEFKSVRAAAVTAGIVKPPTLLEAALRVVSRLSPADLESSIETIRRYCGHDAAALDALDKATVAGPGNPTGVNQHSKVEGITDNVSNSKKREKHGNDKQYAIRKLLINPNFT